MNDFLQVVLVTLAALVALVVIARPYLRRPSASSTPCANCAIGAARRPSGSVQPFPVATRPEPR